MSQRSNAACSERTHVYKKFKCPKILETINFNFSKFQLENSNPNFKQIPSGTSAIKRVTDHGKEILCVIWTFPFLTNTKLMKKLKPT